MAVWFTTERAKVGPVFGFIDKFEGLGIFFDTYANARHPVSGWSKIAVYKFIFIFTRLSNLDGSII
jgi:hypothetical protein